MKIRFLSLLLSMCLLLSGCGWLDGSYVSVTPHREQRPAMPLEALTVSTYSELTAALEQMVSSGQETAAIHLADYPKESAESNLHSVERYIQTSYPLGAYAVENIQCELGTSGAVPAVAVTITYRRSAAEIRRVRKCPDMDNVQKRIAEALESCSPGTVMLVEEYSQQDLAQFVQDYGAAHPQIVMEAPQVTENLYGSGRSRVVEVLFTYQNSRDDLRNMQKQVEPVFDAAVLYVSGEGAQRQKFAQLYAFLMERFDYKVETSLTPAYSLLRHGVGDSRAFATVYAAMCRDAGLECLTVTGTCAGEPRTWNIVREDGIYYHVDLLQCSAQGRYGTCLDEEMSGYVWDYSAYPACTGQAPQPEQTEPTEPAEK